MVRDRQEIHGVIEVVNVTYIITPFGQDALSIREGNRGDSVEHYKALIQIQICKILQQCSDVMTENGCWTALYCTALDLEQPCWSQ